MCMREKAEISIPTEIKREGETDDIYTERETHRDGGRESSYLTGGISLSGIPLSRL